MQKLLNIKRFLFSLFLGFYLSRGQACQKFKEYELNKKFDKLINFLISDSNDSNKLYNSNNLNIHHRSGSVATSSAIGASANSAGNHSDTDAIDEEDDELVNDHVIRSFAF